MNFFLFPLKRLLREQRLQQGGGAMFPKAGRKLRDWLNLADCSFKSNFLFFFALTMKGCVFP